MSAAPGIPAPWPYALELYARPGVEPLLLELQDAHGQCASFLIFSLWEAASGRALDDAALAAAAELARAWEAVATLPLRRARRRLKAVPRSAPASAREPVRQGVENLEIEAERMLLRMLEEAAGGVQGEAVDRLESLTRAAAAFGGAPADLLDRLARLAS